MAASETLNRESAGHETGKKVRKTTKIELGSGVTLYRSGEMKLGETVTETVTDVRLQDFRSEPEDEANKKWVLVFESGKGLALNFTNTKFLVESGIGEYEMLIGRKVKLVKEARLIDSLNKGSHDVVGIFIKEIS